MNDWLAQLYGTAPAVDADEMTNMNKTASVALLEKVALEVGADFDGIDIDSLSEEDAEELLEELFSEMGDDDTPAAEFTDDDDGDLDKESMAKLAEADFYGRAMAHAYVDELHTLEKTAASKGDARERLKMALTGWDDAPDKDGDKKCKGCEKSPCMCGKGGKGGEKTSAVLDSAIDHMAVDLANQWIEENGLSKRAVSEDVQTAVQQRAVELLIENGYVDPSDVG